MVRRETISEAREVAQSGERSPGLGGIGNRPV